MSLAEAELIWEEVDKTSAARLVEFMIVSWAGDSLSARPAIKQAAIEDLEAVRRVGPDRCPVFALASVATGIDANKLFEGFAARLATAESSGKRGNYAKSHAITVNGKPNQTKGRKRGQK